MCGFLVNVDHRFGNETNRYILQHRGPDDTGEKHVTLANGAVSLQHSRLSILDTSDRGHQPMGYGNGRYWVVYNGEIYNYIELRSTLAKLGHRFRSNTDTEVILSAYAQFGTQCLHKFNGMFAFCILDRENGELFAARDRYGIKPMYWWHVPGKFLRITSEIKQFCCFPEFRAALDEQVAVDFLRERKLDHTNKTFFRNIRQLRGGHSLHYSIGGSLLRVEKWYDLREKAWRKVSISRGEAVETFRSLFFNAVSLQLRSDVRVGSCLSGGLDSSSIVCVANRLLRSGDAQARQNAFSSCFDLAKFDERPFIREVEKRTEVKSHYVFPSLHGFFQDFERFIWHNDEPVWSMSMYAQWCLFKCAKENHVKVILDGQGADELLGGYFLLFYQALLKQRLERNDFSVLIEDLIRSVLKGNTSVVTALYNVSGGAHLKKKGRLRQSAKVFTKRRSEPLGAKKPRSFEELSAALINYDHLPALLHFEDRNSMAHSVEARVPFLDHNLVEFCLSVPPEYLISPLRSKLLLRNAMQNVLPEKVRLRSDKMGFVTPQEKWMSEEGFQWFMDAIKDESGIGLVNIDYCREYFAQIARRGRGDFSLVWRIISFLKWCEVYNVTPA